MKKFILSALTALTLSSAANAFVPSMEFFVNRELAIARVWNTTPRPILCSGYAFGRTFRGVDLNSWVNITVQPGVYVDVYVYSNIYDPMIQSWAQIDCRIW